MRKRVRIRFKRWAWLGARWGVVPLAVVGLRLGWGWEAGRRLARVEGELGRLGMPVGGVAGSEKVPEGEDAVVPFIHALSAFKFTTEEREVVDPNDPNFRRDVSEFTPEQVAGLKRIWQEKQAMVEELDLAGGRTRYGWTVDFEFYYGEHSTFSLGDARQVTNFFGSMAIVAGAEHQNAEALHHLRRMLEVARIVDKQPLLISHLVATAIRNMAVDVFERVDPTLDWQGDAVMKEGGRLLAALKDAAEPADMGAMWKGEMRYFDEEVHRQSREASWWLLPMVDDDEAQGLQRSAAHMPVARAQTYPEARARLLPPLAGYDVRLTKVVHGFSGDVYDSPERLGLLHFRGLAATRACAVLLAARLYGAEHGREARGVEELVPEYLGAVPVDPFDVGGKGLRFRQEGAGVTVWSVGENGKDEGGVLKAGAGYARMRGHGDLVFGAGWRAFLGTMPVP